MPGAAAVEVADPHLGGREQRRVDLVEVVLVVAEDVAERAPVVARCGRRQALGQITRDLVAAAHLQVHPAAVEDGVVGAPHRHPAVRTGRRQGRGGMAVDHVGEREAELVRLVHRHLEHARHHLGGAGEAGGGGQHQGQAIGGEAAVAQHLVDHHRGRTTVDFQHQHAGVRLVAVAEFGEQILAAGERARRAGTQREELLAARLFLAGREAPAGVLAGEAGQHRLRAAHLQPVGPALFHARGQAHAAQPAHADLADQHAGGHAAAHVDTRVDQTNPVVQALDRDAERVGRGQQLRKQRRGQAVHTQRARGPRHRVVPGFPGRAHDLSASSSRALAKASRKPR